MAPLIVDHEDKLESLLAHLEKRTSQGCFIFVDIEGVNLSRKGTVAIMQLLIPPESVVYLIDVHILGSTAFSLTNDSGISLKSLLESGTVFKVFFDIRNDSDALYAHYGIKVAGIIDLQILEYATRMPRGKYVNGLARCIERDLPYVPGWSTTKAKGQRLFRPDQGGKYEVFLERPLQDDIVKYCEQDVMLMPQLLARYGPRLRPEIASRVQTVVNDRILLSQSATYNPHGRDKAIGPSLGYTVMDAKAKLSSELCIVRSPQLQKLCRLDNVSIPDLVAEFDAMDLKRTLTSLGSWETSSTAGTVTTSVPAQPPITKSPTPPTTILGPIGSALALTLARQEQEHPADDDELAI